MDNINETYKPALLSAEKQLKYLRNLPSQQWTIVNNNESTCEIYTHEAGQVKTLKAVKDLSANQIDLRHIYASLSTIEMRTKWCPLFKDLSVSHPNQNTSIIKAKIAINYHELQEQRLQDNDNERSSEIFMVEQTIKKRHHVEYISTPVPTLSTSAAVTESNQHFMAIEVENRFGNARATIYLGGWNKNEEQVETLISSLLMDLIEVKPFPWISQCDKAIQIRKSIYSQDILDLEYTFTEDHEKDDSAAVEINNKKTRAYHHHRWHSGSWDQQADNTQTLRKNKFLSSSSLLFSGSNTSPKLTPSRVMSSYPDKQQSSWLSHRSDLDMEEEEDEQEMMMTKSLKDQLRIEVDYIPKLIISLPEYIQWSNKFAQLCVRCYRRPATTTKRSSYVIQVLHPYKLLQYFKQQDNNDIEETMKLDDEEEEASTIKVNLILKVSPDDNQFIVNDNEWPIRLWNLSEEDDKSSSSSSSGGEEEEENEDIFVDGMENIDTIATPTTNILPPPLLSNQSSSFDNTEKQGPSVINKEVLPTTTKKIQQNQAETFLPLQSPVSVAADQKVVSKEQRQTLNQKTSTRRKSKDSNKVEIPPVTPLPLLPPPHDSIVDIGIDHEEEEEIEDKVIQETLIPDHDPVALQKAYPQFSTYLKSNYEPAPTLVQSPCKENGYVAIKKLEIPDHPMGGFLSESTWKHCSIWDIKAVLESTGARKIWDNTFEHSSFLHALTPTSSIYHTKMKGAWPVNPRDYVCFHGSYRTTFNRVDLLSTSCIGDSFQYKPLPKEVSGYVRATMDVMGWRLERIDATTASVKQVMVTQFSSWVINYITSRFLVQSCAAVQQAKEYLQTFGAPPSLENLSWASLVNLKYDHEKRNWRCEYTRRSITTDADSNNMETGNESTASAATTASTSPPSTTSLIRLDKRKWASGYSNRYSVVIDPPPSRVSALEKVSDPYGVWVTVQHDEEFIIPLRGKILVLIKPDLMSASTIKDGNDIPECHLNVNGMSTIIEKELRPITPIVHKSSSSASFLKDKVKEKEKDETIATAVDMQSTAAPLKRQLSTTTPTISEEDQINTALDELTVSPKDRAEAALSFLKQTDEQFGWTVISDNNKTGLRVSKKPGVKNSNSSSPSSTTKKNTLPIIETSTEESTSTPTKPTLVVPEPYMIYKASKVIENFSVDEVTAVVTDIGNLRKAYDDTLQHIHLIRQLEPGCRVLNQSVKAIFPFKNREIYATSCLAHEISTTTTSPNKRTMYIESSLPDFPTINTKTAATRGNLYMSGWILEPIDPYTTTTNHPIPSMRVTYVTALDLGNSVPSYISNLVANNWVPKKIQSVETYLKQKGPPPFISQPIPVLTFSNNNLSKHAVDQDDTGIEWIAIDTNYDKEKHQYKVTSRLKLDPAAAAASSAAAKKKTSSTASTSTTKSKDELPSVTPTASTSVTLLSPPIRRASTHTISSPGIGTRRGSLPVNALPKKRIVPIAAPCTSSSTAAADSNKEKPVLSAPSVTFLNATFDLRDFAKGYEIQAQLHDLSSSSSKRRKNVSSKLVLSISEPSLSHFIDGKKKPIKHTILIKAPQGLLSNAAGEYEFEFSLVPAKEETLQIKSTRLTVSHVLGDDDEEENSKKWNGIIMVNNVETQIGKDVVLQLLEGDNADAESIQDIERMSPVSQLEPQESNTSIETTEGGGSDANSSTSTSADENQSNEDGESSTKALQYIGGGVVATALGNVSAGVNNLGARMMIPFRAASNSFLLSNNNTNKSIENEEKYKLEKKLELNSNESSSSAAAANAVVGSSDDEEEDEGGYKRRRGFLSKEEKRKIKTGGLTLHEVRLLRKSSDTMRKGMLLLMICLGLAVVFALLMVQPMLERYYASFTASSTVASLDKSIDRGIVRRLVQIPWFGGWDIQVIAVRRGNQ